MDAKELRIGNLVFDEFDKIIKIQSIEYDEINDDMLIYYNKYIDCCFIKDDCKPIILTEELTINLGFKFSHKLFDSKIFRKGIYFVSILKNNISFGIKENESSKWVTLKRLSNFSVHELQNLYFALTGKELTL